ncbi:hypothetical protein WJX72_005617 [[Myrmecia] bisecta]|uniref:Uncharacterized protein n=1 Tax=[Myrmecia] bisecta TaxID=41462 RepID=A0AAW1PYG1_9CHLO
MVSDAAVNGLSGALGGIAALVSTYPLQTVSTIQATHSKRQQTEQEQGLCKQTKQGAWQDFVQVIRTSGWAGLYRGLKPSLLGTAVSQGIYFYLYSSLRQAAVAAQQRVKVTANPDDIGIPLSLVVASLAGCGNVLLTSPIWVVATRMQAHHGRQPEAPAAALGAVSVCKEILQESGPLGFWRGVLPSLLMVTNPTVNYVLLEWLLARLVAWRRRATGKVTKPNALEVFAMSALAKLGATMVTYPLLLVKARLQSAGKHTHQDRQYAGTLDALQRIWSTEGFTGFYKGLRAKLAQSILAAALMMMIKEELTQATRAMLLSTPVDGVLIMPTLVVAKP